MEGPFPQLQRDVFSVELSAMNRNGPNIGLTVTTLGTGAMLPSKYRNGTNTCSSYNKFEISHRIQVSSTLLSYCKANTWHGLLDCGENTFGQLFRLFENLNDFLVNLKFIFISHCHGDHHLGLAGVVREWQKVFPL
jgi:ribonuclease Z